MNNNTIEIASAIIRLNQDVYYSEEHCFWAWVISLKLASLPNCPKHQIIEFPKNIWICMGETEQEAQSLHELRKKAFQDIGISDGDLVTVIYDSNGIVAIGRQRKSLWIHVTDEFKLKTLKELNLSFEISFN